MAALVFKFLDGFAKSRLQLSDLAEYKLRKTKEDRRVNASFSEVVNDLKDIGGEVLILRCTDDEMTLSIDAKVVGAPIVDPIGLDALFNYRAQLLPLIAWTGNTGKIYSLIKIRQKTNTLSVTALKLRVSKSN